TTSLSKVLKNINKD
ncbi:hypothetical protein ACNFK3_004101, partial [Shigella flexneri]